MEIHNVAHLVGYINGGHFIRLGLTVRDDIREASEIKELERELLEQKTIRQRRRTTKTVAQKHMIP